MIKNQIRTELFSSQFFIRRARNEDREQLFAAVKESLADLSVWMPWAHSKYSRTDSEEFLMSAVLNWEEGIEYNFFIFDKESHRLLGGCGLNRIDQPNKTANAGYWIRSSEIGKGIATRSTLLTALFAFEDLKLNRIEIISSVDNFASLKVAKKIGAKKEGILRKRMILKNKIHDAVLFSLLGSDIKEIKLKLNRY